LQYLYQNTKAAARLIHLEDFRFDGPYIVLNPIQVISKFQTGVKELYPDYGRISKNILKAALLESPEWLEEKNSVRYGTKYRTTGWVFDYLKLVEKYKIDLQKPI
jgi:hypothetical protein